MFGRRGRFKDLIERQLSIYMADHRGLFARMAEAKSAYEGAGADEAEELFGDYMDLVEEAEEELLSLRDTYAEGMAARDRRSYEAEFYRAAEKRLPSLAARRQYRRATDPDTYA
jgi:hypothetical protein